MKTRSGWRLLQVFSASMVLLLTGWCLADESNQAVATDAATNRSASSAGVNTKPQTQNAESNGIDQAGIKIGENDFQCDAKSLQELCNLAVTLKKQRSGMGTFSIVALAAVIMPFALPVFIVGMALYFRNRRENTLHETLRIMIEKGMPIPPELISTKQRWGRSLLLNGSAMIATGLGLLLFLSGFSGRYWAFGLIPLLIGVAEIVLWQVEQKNNQSK